MQTTVQDETLVRIDWTPPYANSEPITAYRIIIQQANGVFSEQIEDCDGSDATNIANTYCDIPMTVLRAAPYSLVQKAIVIAKVSAKNVIGWSPISLPNTAGAQI